MTPLRNRRPRQLERSEHEVYFTSPSLSRRDHVRYLYAHHPLFHPGLAVDRRIVRIGTRRYWMLTVLTNRLPVLSERFRGVHSFTATIVSRYGKKRKGSWHNNSEYCTWDLDAAEGEPVSLPLLDGEPPENSIRVDSDTERIRTRRGVSSDCLFRFHRGLSALICCVLVLVCISACVILSQSDTGNRESLQTGAEETPEPTYAASVAPVLLHEVLTVINLLASPAAGSLLHLQSLEIYKSSGYELVFSGVLPVQNLSRFRAALESADSFLFDLQTHGIRDERFAISVRCSLSVQEQEYSTHPGHRIGETLVAALFIIGKKQGFTLEADSTTGTDEDLIIELPQNGITAFFKTLCEELGASGLDIENLRMFRSSEDKWVCETVLSAGRFWFDETQSEFANRINPALFVYRLPRSIPEMIPEPAVLPESTTGQTVPEVGKITLETGVSLSFRRGDQGNIYGKEKTR